MLSGVLSSYEKYFVPDDSEYREDGEHIDILIQKRNLRAQKVCMKYNDLHRPEHYNLSSLMEWNPIYPLPNTGAVERFKVYTMPKMAMCSARYVAHEALSIFSKEALTIFPVPTQTQPKKIIKQETQKKKKVPKAMAGLRKEVRTFYKEDKAKKPQKSLDKLAKSSEYSGFSKVLLVMHPFLRLAKSYKQIFESGSANKDLRVTLEKYMDPKAHTPFHGFVKFVIHGRTLHEIQANQLQWNVKELEEMYELRKPWLPTHYDCEICHADLYPNFIYKVDDDSFEDEFMEFLEDFGLEEVNGGEAAEQLIENVNVYDKEDLKKYFSQISESLLNEMAHFYRIDLEMFGYLDMSKFL